MKLSRISLMLTALALVTAPVACKKKSSKKSNPPVEETEEDVQDTRSETPTTSTPQSTTPAFSSFSQFQGRSLVFQQSISSQESVIRGALAGPLMGSFGPTTKLVNGTISQDAEQRPEEGTSTVVCMIFRPITALSNAEISAATAFNIEQANYEETRYSFSQLILEGSVTSGDAKISRIVCRKNKSAGAMTPGEVINALGNYVKIQ